MFEEQPSIEKRHGQENPTGIKGLATLQGPTVFKAEKSDSTVPGEGALYNISVEIQPGKGRVLVQTTPLTGIGFQEAENTAVLLAETITGKSLSRSDIIFSIDANDQISRVEGPSAGVPLTLLAISAINSNTKLNDSITLTGTIDSNGNIGKVGGILGKAKVAKAGGKTLFLIPRNDSELVIHTYLKSNFGGLTIVERASEIVDAKEYIEKNEASESNT